jgi:tryptophan synthase beta chain
LLAVEPSSCPTLTTGRFEYDFGDTAGLTPLLSMYTLGHDFIPPSIHAGGCATTGTRRSSPLAAKEEGKEKVILFNYSGHGLLDLSAYDAYLHDQLVD